MKSVRAAAVLLGCTAFLAGCMPSSTTGLSEQDIHFIQFEEVQEGREIAVIETTAGQIKMVLFPEEAPNTVAYFKKLVSEGFYNGKELFVNTSVKTMTTGAVDEYGSKGALETENGEGIPCEITPNLWHFSGAVSVMGYQKSKLFPEMLSDSRFFIIGDVEATTDMVSQMEEYQYPRKVIDAYKEYGGLPQYTGSYTVFGQIIGGMDIVEQITSSDVDDQMHPKDGTKVLSVSLSTYRAEDAAVLSTGNRLRSPVRK